MRLTLSSLVILILVISSVSAAPIITSSSRSFIQGQDISISGNGFGIKNPVEPWLWDNFNDGVVGQNVSDDVSLVGDIPYDYYTSPAEYNVVPGGSIGVYYHDGVGAPDDGSTARGTVVVWGQATQKRYVSYDFYVNDFGTFSGVSPTELGIWKVNRQTSNLLNGGSDNPPYDDYPGFGWGHTIYYNNCDQFVEPRWCNDPVYSDCDFPPLNNWNRIEAYETMSDVDMPNGEYRLWYNHVEKYGSDSIITCSSTCTNGCQIDTWMSPVLVNDVSEEEIMVDNLYIDNIQARVEVCNNVDKDVATHCEMQIPHTTWNDSNITFEVNFGSFSQEEVNAGLYLFVVDEFGNVSNGFPINTSNPLPQTCNNDNNLDVSEQCDGTDLGSAVCPACGDMSCTSSCSLDYASCFNYPALDYDRNCFVDLGDITAASSLKELVLLGRNLLG